MASDYRYELPCLQCCVSLTGPFSDTSSRTSNGPENLISKMSADARSSLDLDKNGNHDSLRFPAFHQEMVNAIGWDAGDSIGRVKVTIAEGFAKAQSNSPFERVRNIVSFTFQHAPLGTSASP